jgi:hypothetical protein
VRFTPGAAHVRVEVVPRGELRGREGTTIELHVHQGDVLALAELVPSLQASIPARASWYVDADTGKVIVP